MEYREITIKTNKRKSAAPLIKKIAQNIRTVSVSRRVDLVLDELQERLGHVGVRPFG